MTEPSAEPANPDFQGQTVGVLFVDDNPADVLIAEETLRQILSPKVDVFVAHSVDEALESLQTNAIDVCITDYHLSTRETAMDLLKGARHLGIGIPFISVTGRTDEDSLAHELLAAGFDDVIHKDDLEASNIYRIVRNAWLRNHHSRHVELLAGTDELTGLDNRRTFIRRIQVELDRTNRIKVAFSLLYLDLNHFKQLNDEFGHAAGDAALVHFARTLESLVRVSDGVARIGGDEFVVLAPSCSAAMAKTLKQKIQQSLAKSPVSIGDRKILLKTSIGTATYDAIYRLEHAEELIQIADSAMYADKLANS